MQGRRNRWLTKTAIHGSRPENPSIPGADTTTPEYRKHPPRPHLTGAKRGNPVVVWTPIQ
jgi:hypothetical protein